MRIIGPGAKKRLHHNDIRELAEIVVSDLVAIEQKKEKGKEPEPKLSSSETHEMVRVKH
ncbi:hypothetical protein ACFL5H_02880 [Candidatus Latescibacterota bacterium]